MMSAQPTADIAAWGCRQLDAIASAGVEGQLAAVAANAPAAIIAALFAHSGNADVAAWACRAIGSIVVYSDTGQRNAVLAGAPSAIASALLSSSTIPCPAASMGSLNWARVLQWGWLALIRLGQLFPCFQEAEAGSSCSISAGAIARFCGAVHWRLPHAQICRNGSDLADSRGLTVTIAVGCEADEHFVRDLARGCGIHPLPENIVVCVSDWLPPSGFTAVESRYATGLAEWTLAQLIDEARRLLPFVSIEHRLAAVDSVLSTSVASSAVSLPCMGEAEAAPDLPGIVVRVVVPISRVVVTNAVVALLLERFRLPGSSVTVWVAKELDCEMPAPGALLGVRCPKLGPCAAPRTEVVEITGDHHRRIFVDHIDAATSPAPREWGIISSAGGYVMYGRRMFLLTSGHGFRPHTCQNACAIRSFDDNTRLSDNFRFVGSVWPSNADSATPMFLYRPVVGELYEISAVADISLFEVPTTYESGAVLQSGSAFAVAGDPVVMSTLNEGSIGTLITCSFNNGTTGVYRVCGIAESIAGACMGRVGPVVMHYSYTAQYVEGTPIQQGYPGALARTASMEVHSFVRSLVASVSASDRNILLLDEPEGHIFDGTCFAGASGTVERYAYFTPAGCALSQAARILGTRDLREVAYVGVPQVTPPLTEPGPAPAASLGLAARIWHSLGSLCRRGM